MNVTAIDCSHKDRPSLQFKASEVISSRDGTLILGASIDPHTPIDYNTVPTSISNLARDLFQGFDFTLSHDWVVKAH